MSSAASWSTFSARAQEAARTSLDAVCLPDALDQADGAAQFANLVEAALRWEFRSGDANFPRFVEINDTPELADNIFAPIRGDAAYRLSGNVATLFDFNISIHTNWGWIAPSKTSGDLGRTELAIAPDGSFELFLGGEPREGNWLPLPADAAYIQIREYHPDYKPSRPGVFELTRVDANPAPERLTQDDIAAKLDRAAAWAGNYVAFHLRAQARLFPEEENALRPPTPIGGGNSHIWYGFGRFALAPGEALLLEFDQPNARLWGVQWLKAGWYENADLHNRFTSLPGGEAHVDADSKVRVVLSAFDPGVPNWLDTTGYASGLFVTRWIWCANGPTVRARVVKRAELAKHLPDETPAVTHSQRAAQLARRRTHFAHRRR